MKRPRALVVGMQSARLAFFENWAERIAEGARSTRSSDVVVLTAQDRTARHKLRDLGMPMDTTDPFPRALVDVLQILLADSTIDAVEAADIRSKTTVGIIVAVFSDGGVTLVRLLPSGKWAPIFDRQALTWGMLPE